jgi:predicted MFS family arabinose efflux permease
VDACSLALSATLMRTIRSQEPEPATIGQRGSIGQDISEGLRWLYRDLLLRTLAGSSMIYLFFNSVMLAVYVLYATRSLAIAPPALGLIFGLGGAGALLGAMIAARAARHLGIGPAMIGANLLGGLSLLLIPLAGNLPFSATLWLGLAQVISQMMGAIFYINQTGLRLAITPDHVLGRMNASYRFLTMGAIPLGSFIGGLLGETIGLRTTLIVGGLGMLLPVLWLLRSPARALQAIDAQAHAAE